MELLEKVVTKVVLDKAFGILVTVNDLITPQVQEILDQIALYSVPIPQVELGVQPNPPWGMTYHLVDGKLGSEMNLRGEVVDELREENEENGWKMCKRRSKVTNSEPKVEAKKKKVKISMPPVEQPIPPLVVPEVVPPEISGDLNEDLGTTDEPVEVGDDTPIFEDFEEKYIPFPQDLATSSNQLPPLIPPENDIPEGDEGEQALSRGERGNQGRKRGKIRPTNIKGQSFTVLDEVWHKEYDYCPIFGEKWKQAMGGGDPWPEGVRIHAGKMYLKEKLCVPTGLGERVVGACHVYGGHMGVNKLVKAIEQKYLFVMETSKWKMAKLVKKQCNVCQACEPPTCPKVGKIDMTPIPAKIMQSVAMDIFSPPKTVWQG